MTDTQLSARYKKSNDMVKEVEAIIPLASQTFSKSKIAYPQGVSPLFLEKGEGAKVWDVDGNQYIDFVSGLLSLSLGYKDPDVDQAVIEQLANGVSFSLPHRLEFEVAQLLVDLIPSAEQVRFGKNGTDATSAAIRLARAYTKRERIAVCGYHGWQDWYIGSTTRDAGVPKSVKSLTHVFQYNDIASLKQILESQPNEFAAVIMEPMNVAFPKDDFLQQVADLTRAHGALFIFDETITGFRFHIGGAQTLFGVTPDLSTFGKGMANGYPVSAIVGRAEIMNTMEEIFFSGTFGGETLSLAAAKATINKQIKHQVSEQLTQKGQWLVEQLQQLIKDIDGVDYFETAGHPAWSFLVVKDGKNYSALELKSLLYQEMYRKGILLNGGHNLTFAHTDADLQSLFNAYQSLLPYLMEVDTHKNLHEHLVGQAIQPVFKVR